MQLERTESKHLSSKIMHRSSESVLSIENREIFLLNLAAPQNHMGFPGHMSGYTIILSSSAKFLCLHIQEQKKYFASSTILPPCVITFFSQVSSFSHTILLPTEEDSTFLPCDKQPPSPISDLNLNQNWYAISLYVVKTFQALSSLNFDFTLGLVRFVRGRRESFYTVMRH